jgi:hypothetical protein
MISLSCSAAVANGVRPIMKIGTWKDFLDGLGRITPFGRAALAVCLIVYAYAIVLYFSR